MIELAIKLSDEQVGQLATIVAEKIGNPSQKISCPMTIPELAKILKIHESTLYRQIQAGNVKRIPSLSRVLVPASEVNRLLGN